MGVMDDIMYLLGLLGCQVGAGLSKQRENWRKWEESKKYLFLRKQCGFSFA